jgi:hypothetical protein
MSSNRNVITWKTPEGTWSVAEINDRDGFEWFASGYRDDDAALDGYCEWNSNPGGCSIIQTPTAEQLADFDARAAECPSRYRRTVYGTQSVNRPRY